jgi:hypothetical protein
VRVSNGREVVIEVCPWVGFVDGELSWELSQVAIEGGMDCGLIIDGGDGE